MILGSTIFSGIVEAKINLDNIIEINKISTNEYLHYLEKFNFTDEEIVNLYQIDADNFEKKIYLPEELAKRTGINYVSPTFKSFPSHLKEGYKHRISYDVNFQRALLEAGLISGGVVLTAETIALLSPELIIKAIATIARLGATGIGLTTQIYYYWKSDGFRYTGVRGETVFEYRITNDGYLDWQYNHHQSWGNYY